jgi:hypothetical protein
MKRRTRRIYYGPPGAEERWLRSIKFELFASTLMGRYLRVEVRLSVSSSRPPLPLLRHGLAAQ